MRNASKILILFAGAVAIAACGQKATENAASQDLSLDSDVTNGQLPDNADIETLPPDESSEATPGELNSGVDNPDVNGIGNGH